MKTMLSLDAEDLIMMICKRLSSYDNLLTYELEYNLLFDLLPYRIYFNGKQTKVVISQELLIETNKGGVFEEFEELINFISEEVYK